MVQNVIREIGGVGLYGVISILLFTFVFGGAFVLAIAMKKSEAEKLSALPLEGEDEAHPRARGTGVVPRRKESESYE
jgi:hypothetical protein